MSAAFGKNFCHQNGHQFVVQNGHQFVVQSFLSVKKFGKKSDNLIAEFPSLDPLTIQFNSESLYWSEKDFTE